MLKVQTLSVECAKREKVGYELSVEVNDYSGDVHELVIVGPDGQPVPHKLTGDVAQFEYTSGPGVDRFQAVVRSKSSQDPIDAITLEVVVLPETDSTVREAIKKVIAGMDLRIQGSSIYGQYPPVVPGFQLQKEFGDMAAVEVLRHLALDRGDASDDLRCLFLLSDLIVRCATPWMPALAFAVLGDMISSVSENQTATKIIDLMERLVLNPRQKWIYLTLAAQGCHLIRARAITLLQTLVPSDYRALCASLVLELCTVVTDGRIQACELFRSFSYEPAAPEVVEWVQTGEAYTVAAACRFLASINYRAAAPELRKLLGRVRSKEVIDCLSAWQDRDSLDAMLKELSDLPDDSYEVQQVTTMLLRFGPDIVKSVRAIQSQSGPSKSKAIENALASTAFAKTA